MEGLLFFSTGDADISTCPDLSEGLFLVLHPWDRSLCQRSHSSPLLLSWQILGDTFSACVVRRLINEPIDLFHFSFQPSDCIQELGSCTTHCWYGCYGSNFCPCGRWPFLLSEHHQWSLDHPGNSSGNSVTVHYCLQIHTGYMSQVRRTDCS